MTTDPLALLREWLPGTPGRDGYFPLLSLATTDLDGRPDVRTVLLSEIVHDGLAFHTDARSRKAAQLANSPSAALVLTVPEEARQVVVTGTVRAATAVELDRAYRARSRYLQVLAWLNTAESAELPPSERRRIWATFEAEHPDGALDPPPDWTGFVLRPSRCTFWLGGPGAPSHRTEYTLTENAWAVSDLPG